MNDGARDHLARMVKSYGVQIVSTPQSCEIFLKQQCGDYPEELEALTKALRAGLVGRLLKHPTSPPWEEFAGELTRDLVGSGMREDVANWVVVSWAMALGKHPSMSGPAESDRIPTEPPRDRPAAPVRKKLTGQALVALGGGAGAAAGVFCTIGILTIVDKAMPSSLPERWVSTSVDDQVHWHRLFGLLTVMAIAGIGGSAGGFFGWLLGRGEPHIAWKGAVRTFGAAFLMAALGCTLALDAETLDTLTSWDPERLGQRAFDLIVVPAASMIAATGAALSVAFKGTIR